MRIKRRRILSACVDCGLSGPHGGYEKCLRCYRKWLYAKVRTPRITWPAADLIAEVGFLAEQRIPHHDVARKLGLQWPSIVTAHRRAGVPMPDPYRFTNSPC